MSAYAFGCFTDGTPTSERFDARDLTVSPGTRHHMLLTSNETPIESDLDTINRILSKADARLAYLDHAISRLQDGLADLEEERTWISGFRMLNKGILSPLRRMPPEILCEIFAYTLPVPSADAAVCAPLNLSASPWVLTHISSRWRTMALSIPSLWSQLVINYQEESAYHPSSPMVDAQIRRAHDQKLHIAFYGRENLDARPQVAMLEVLMQHSLRWEVLTLGLTSGLVPLLPALRDRVPSLARLWIQWDVAESQRGVQSINCFQTAPCLLDVGICNEYRAIPVLIPAHQLTRYELDAPWEIHWSILLLALNLVEANITLSFDRDPWPTLGETAALLHLRRLCVAQSEVLHYLKTPSLDGLALAIREQGPDVFVPLESLIIHSACSLRALTLIGYPPASATTGVLEKYPSITKLSIISEPGYGAPDTCSNALNALVSHLVVPDPVGTPSRPLIPLIAPQLSEIYVGCQNGPLIRVYT
ncbi:hypothetical protein DFH07DRAFT_880567 [Mycena maculata]|uniref:F-box domain-containing protein n=1 Tax=Mycena maculata TaxID=230809 RepID=A0AAD7NPM9_9AGAR|nr:hypothetical protein DFH07DRAFT_880567 [Mycena maculata]